MAGFASIRMPRLIVASAACGRCKKPVGGLAAFVRALARVLLAARSGATCAADLLATAWGGQAHALWQRGLWGGFAIRFRNDFVAHCGTLAINKTDIKPQMAARPPELALKSAALVRI